ncbi:MAG: S41 family peptidase [Desulfobacterales bacterium]|nr:S41 family peptidase [Desulfobacterales bacterium]
MKIKYKNLKNISIIFSFIVFLVAAFLFGIYFGYAKRPEIEKVLSVTNKETQVETTADFSSFWKVWNKLNEKSIYAKNISDQEKVWGAISGLASAFGDSYTVFFPPEENKLFNEEIKGSFGGIGAEVGIKNKVLTVIAPLKNNPAWNAGIKAGDKILKIDNIETTDMTIDKAIKLIHGEKGTVVTLTILRLGEKVTREIKIIRDIIEVPVIETELTKDNIFIIKFYSFSEKSTELFKQALLEFNDSKSHKMIIDLRGNPGGYLSSAINIASWFIDEGKIIVREDFGDKRKEEVYRSHGPRLFTDKLQLIVLIDGGSASASEILAGALKEHKIATLIGETTFGKGSVQELIEITKDTSLKVTVAKWLTPEGISISDKGLEPNIKISITQKDFEAKRDPQMNKAVEILSAQD